MNENVANDVLRAVILVEPVHGSRHTYNVEVRNAKSDSESLLTIEAADFTPLYNDVLSNLKDTIVTDEVKIIRGCFHGTLAEFKDRIDENFGRTALDSEQYYAFVKYMHDKVASKRYYAILPLVQESLKVFDCLNGISFRPSYRNQAFFSTRIPNRNNGVTNLLRAIDEYDKFRDYYHRNFN